MQPTKRTAESRALCWQPSPAVQRSAVQRSAVGNYGGNEKRTRVVVGVGLNERTVEHRAGE